MKGSPMPALLTTSPAGTAFARAGVLGLSTTTTVFGGKHLNEGERDGGRLTIGGWVDDEHTLGAEVNALALQNHTTTFAAGGPGRILFRPFSDVSGATQTPAAMAVSVPGVINGRVAISNGTDGLVGAGVLFRENLWGGCQYRIDVIGGYRYLQFADRLAITETATNLIGGAIPNVSPLLASAGVPPGTTAIIRDRFDATNDFHGFDFGVTGEYRQGPWRLRGTLKMAVGENFEIVDINGSTTAIRPGGATTQRTGGFLALISNVGHLTRDRSIIVPEGNVQLGVQLTPAIRAWVGYTGLYWSEAVWSSKQIDHAINTNLLPPSNGQITSGQIRPTPLFGGTSLWAEGVDVGLEVRY
jgi:hypothetical protein